MKRVAVATASVLASVNIWTGAPLLALWVGSRTVPTSGLSMTAVFVVLSVTGAAIAFEVWFFLFAGSSPPNGS